MQAACTSRGAAAGAARCSAHVRLPSSGAVKTQAAAARAATSSVPSSSGRCSVAGAAAATHPLRQRRGARWVARSSAPGADGADGSEEPSTSGGGSSGERRRGGPKRRREAKAKAPGFFEIRVITPPPKSLGVYELHPLTHNGEEVVIDGEGYVVQRLVLQYKLRGGRYHRDHNALEVTPTGRWFTEQMLSNLMEARYVGPTGPQD